MRLRMGMAVIGALLSLAAVPSLSAADTLITPFVGTTFGGDAKVHRPAFGAGVTFVGRSLGLEVELARVNNFFGPDSTTADVTTLTRRSSAARIFGAADSNPTSSQGPD